MQASDVETLAAARGKYRKVRIDRGLDTHLHGYVLDASPELALIFKFNEFHPDGASVVRMGDIQSVRASKFERVGGRIISAEGLLDSVGLAAPPPVDSMHAVLMHLFEGRMPVIVEVEAELLEAEGESEEDDEEDEFLIGYITLVTAEICCVHNFDAAGEWDDEPTPVLIDDITQVQIEAPYTTTFLRHIPPFPG